LLSLQLIGASRRASDHLSMNCTGHSRLLPVDDRSANLAVLDAILAGVDPGLAAAGPGEAALRALPEHSQ